MGAKASQPTHFLKFRLTGFRLSEINCIPGSSYMYMYLYLSNIVCTILVYVNMCSIMTTIYM